MLFLKLIGVFDVHVAAEIVRFRGVLPHSAQRLKELADVHRERDSASGVQREIADGHAVEKHVVNEPAVDYHVSHKRDALREPCVPAPVNTGLYPVLQLNVVDVLILAEQPLFHSVQPDILGVGEVGGNLLHVVHFAPVGSHSVPHDFLILYADIVEILELNERQHRDYQHQPAVECEDYPHCGNYRDKLHRSRPHVRHECAYAHPLALDGALCLLEAVEHVGILKLFVLHGHCFCDAFLHEGVPRYKEAYAQLLCGKCVQPHHDEFHRRSACDQPQQRRNVTTGGPRLLGYHVYYQLRDDRPDI